MLAQGLPASSILLLFSFLLIQIHDVTSVCTCAETESKVLLCDGCSGWPEVAGAQDAPYISLKNNSMKTLTSVPLKKLKLLDLSYNGITRIEYNALLNCTRLTSLNLSHNHISYLESRHLHGPNHLQFLDLSFNDLTSLEDGDTFLDFKLSLKQLNLSYNHISDIDGPVLRNLRKLERLDLSHNDLPRQHGVQFKGLTALKFLNLAHNSLERIDADAFQDLAKLETLDLSHNNLRIIETQAFHGLDASLRRLILSDNSIDSIKDQFRDLHQLRVLDLDRNSIVFIQPKALAQNIEVFNMRRALIHEVTSDVFHGVRGLKEVRISSSPNLIEINPTAFDRNGRSPSLVDFSNNALTTVTRETLMWGNISELYLYGNPWICDCRISWAQNTSVASKLYCHAPPDVEHKHLSQVKGHIYPCVAPEAVGPHPYNPLTRGQSHVIGIVLSLVLIGCVGAFLTWLIIKIYGRPGRRYRTLHEMRTPGVIYHSQGGTVTSGGDVRERELAQLNVNAAEAGITRPYSDLREHSRDGEDTLFSIDDDNDLHPVIQSPTDGSK